MAAAGPCDAHFSFDGNLADSGGNGFDGIMLGDKNQPVTPQFVAGKFGQALNLDGTQAMRSIIDLHIDVCPQVTISAWIRVESEDSKGGYLVSSANGYGPALRLLNNDSVQLVGISNGLIERNILFSGTWQFVALVYDDVKKRYAIHWGAGRKSEKTYTGDPRPPNSALWVGAYTESLNNAVAGITIDELHITGRALDDAEIAQLQSASAGAGNAAVAQTSTGSASSAANCASNNDCPSGTYCAVDGACYANSQLPVSSASGSGSSLATLTPTRDLALEPTSQLGSAGLDLSGISRPDIGASLPAPGSSFLTNTSSGSTGLAGRWQNFTQTDSGIPGAGGGAFALTVDFYGPDTSLSGHIWVNASSFLGQIDQDEAMTSVSRTGNTVSFTTATMGDFTGEVSADGTTITSTVEGPAGPLVLQRVAAGSDFNGEADTVTSDAGNVMAGNWLFTQMSADSPLPVGPSGIHMALEFTGPDSVLSGRLVTLMTLFGNTTQQEEPLTNIVKSGQAVSFSSASFGGSVTGQLSSDETQLTISVSDGTQTGSLVFTRQ